MFEGNSFVFLWVDPVQTPPQNPAPAGSVSSTKESSSEVPGSEGFWGRQLPVEGWLERENKGKRMRKEKGGVRPQALS